MKKNDLQGKTGNVFTVQCSALILLIIIIVILTESWILQRDRV